MMRAWLLTSTTYGTWLPGDPRGSITSVRVPHSAPRVEHDQPGEPWEPSTPALYQAAVSQLKSPPLLLSRPHAGALLGQFQETARVRQWRLLAVAIMVNHFHLVASVDDDPDPHKMLGDLKAYGSRALNRAFGTPGAGTWWTASGSVRKLPDDRALHAAIHYVLHKQPNPLVTWSPTPDEPGA